MGTLDIIWARHAGHSDERPTELPSMWTLIDCSNAPIDWSIEQAVDERVTGTNRPCS